MTESKPTTLGTGHPPRRDAVLVRHYRAVRDETGLREGEFLVALIRAVRELVPEALREGDWPDPDGDMSADQYEALVERVRTRVARWISGAVHMPVWIEEAWVYALPQPYRLACARELARRYGFLGVQADPGECDGLEDVQTMSRISERTARVLQDGSRMLKDLRFGPEDLPDAPQAVSNLYDLAAECHSAVQMIQKGTGYKLPNIRGDANG
jgi:hypothetical protein